MIPGSDERDFFSRSRSPDQLLGQYNPALLVPLRAADEREVHLVEGQQVFIRRNFLLRLRDDRLVILFGVEPDLSIDADDQKERFAISLGKNLSPDFSGDEQTVLVIDGEFVFAEENCMLHGDLFPRFTTVRAYVPLASTSQR